MPKQTTHVLEIEKGVGEPTFIPLAEGEELQPISIGKRGQWRLEGPRVLDVHAYVYFDGKALFAQSADDTSPVQVSGQRIGKQWTEVQLPCRLFIGSAILRCRSLLEEDDSATIAQEGAPPVAAPHAPTLQSRDGLPDLTGEAIDDNAATMARPSPLDRSKPSIRPAAGVPSGPPKTQLLDARPFAPGAFSTRDDESTRNGPPPEFPKRSAAMNEGMGSTGESVARRLPGHPGLEAPQMPSAGGGPMTIVAEGQAAHVGGGRGMLSNEPSVQIADQGPPPMPLGAAPGFGLGGGPGDPPFAGPGAPPPFDPAFGGPQPPPPAFDPAFGPGGVPYDPAFAPPPAQAPVEPVKAGEGPPSLERFKAEWRAASPVKKATWFMFPLVLVAGLSLVFDDDEPAPKRRSVKTLPDGGVISRDGGVPHPHASNGPIVPPSGATAPTGPVVTAPTGGATPPDSASTAQTAAPPSSTEAPQATGATPGATAKEKTLEREAVDALATSNNQKALELYTELAKRNPENQAYQQMVRLLTPRAK